MALSLAELLQPQVILRVVSQIRKGQGRLGRWLGFQPQRFDQTADTALGGPNTLTGPTRYATFRIFNWSRVPAKMRAPNTGPATVAVNPVGEVPIACARAHEKIQLSYEQLGNLSPIMGPNSQVDNMGQDYISRNTQILASHFNNAVEMMSAGMFRDSLYFVQAGDNWLPQFAAPTGSQIGFQVPFQIPAGNKNQLNMLGSGNIITTSWANPAALIFKDLSNIRAAYEQLSGYLFSDAWLNSLTWYSVITNTEIRNLAGTAATPYAEYENVPETFYDGMPSTDQMALLKAEPTIRWHITNEVLITGNTDIDPVNTNAPAAGVRTKVVPDSTCIFSTQPDPTWCQLYLGGEPVVENPGQPAVLRSGYWFWHEYCTQPACVELIGLLNAIPLLYVPSVIAPATVIF